MKLKSNIKSKNVVVKCAADFFLPFALVTSLYVILFGTATSGGGFQGGVMGAAALLLVFLGYGIEGVNKAFNKEVLRVNEPIGATIYIILGLCGIFLGANFCRNVFFDCGAVGDLISGGTITFMSYAVGYKVLTGVGFLLMLMIGLLAPDEDDE